MKHTSFSSLSPPTSSSKDNHEAHKEDWDSLQRGYVISMNESEAEIHRLKAELFQNEEKVGTQLSTLNLNAQLSTLNPQLSTLNPQPSTLNPQPCL